MGGGTHALGWRDAFDVAIKWRQLSEPNDPVLWIDRLAPEAFAERVFEGLAARGFWLIPQPEIFDAAWQARADGVLARRDPELPNF